jgi:hypothetical protein
MKKLLLILLCLPMIGFGQFLTESEDYIPGFLYGYATIDSDPKPEDYLHCFDYPYIALPDSFYGNMGINSASPLPLWGYMNVHPSAPLIFSDLYLNAILVEGNFSQLLNSNNDISVINSSQTGFGSSTTVDSVFYNSNLLRSKIVHREYSSIGPSEYNRTEFIYSGLIYPSEIHYFDMPNSTLPLQVDYVTYNSLNLVNTIETGNNIFEYHYNSNDLLEYILYYHNLALIDTVGLYFYHNNLLPDYCIEKEYDLTNQSLDKIEKQVLNHDGYNRFNKESFFELLNNTWLLDDEINYIYYSTPTIITEHNKVKELIKVTDLLGRETKQTNQPLFYIYDDGTVEKRIVIE